MTPEERRLLEKTAALARENNDILKKVHRTLIVSRAIKIIYWVIIIGVAIGAFYFLQPYVEVLQGAYADIRSAVQNPAEGIQNLFGGAAAESIE